jgi:hypothetical protein
MADESSAERTTSAAKHLDGEQQREGAREEESRKLKDSFEKARQAQKSIERAKSRKASQPGRTTSAAKTYSPEEVKQAMALKEKFERAVAARKEPVRTKAQEQQRDRPRHAPVPQAHLRPDGPIRRKVDRQIFNKEQQKERERSEKTTEALKLRDRVNKALADKAREREPHRSR